MSNLSLAESLSTLSSRVGSAQSWVPRRVEDLKDFNGWRHCSADGNTFYRAAGFAMVEAILRKKPRKIQQFASTLEQAGSQIRGASHSRDAEALERLLLSFQGMGNADALQEFYRKLCFDPDMDRAFVRGIREASAEYLLRNPEVELHDMPLSVVVESAFEMSVEEFIEQRVLRDGVEADDYVLPWTPMAFGLRLEIIQVDQSGSNRYEVPSDKEGHAVASLLWRPGNFDIFYSHNALREVMEIQEPLGMHGGSSSSGARQRDASPSPPPSLLTSRQNRSSARHADEVVEAMRQSLEASLEKTETAMSQRQEQAFEHERRQQETRDRIRTARLDLEADQAALEEKRKRVELGRDEVDRLRREIQWMMMRKSGGLFACCQAPAVSSGAGELEVEDDGWR